MPKFFAALSCLLITNIFGQTKPPIYRILDRCLESDTMLSNIEILGCYAEAEEQWEVILNSSFNELWESKLNDQESRQKFILWKLKWLNYRDKELNFLTFFPEIEEAEQRVYLFFSEAQRLIAFRQNIRAVEFMGMNDSLTTDETINQLQAETEKWETEIQKHFYVLYDMISVDNRVKENIAEWQTAWGRYRKSELEFIEKFFDDSDPTWKVIAAKQKMLLYKNQALKLEQQAKF